ncbi:outer membrane lipoprotein carrier protein LolA [alpha proteobacterium U9-1i]|nr:outer membrane lipoprotein carrier protein LolA [alpha proteobacterium U9-1i]
MALGHMTLMNRRTALFAGLAAISLALPAAAQAPGADLRPRTPPSAIAGLQTLEGAERDAAIAAANNALNGVAAMQGRFVQVSPDGSRAQGAFYLQRPGKLRFEYDPPSSLLIVSDGSVVALRDSALRTTDRTPLRSTPLNLVLRSQVNLARDARIVRVSRQGEWTLVTARDRSGQTDGAITMHFYGAGNELRSWDVVDMTGARTRIALSDISRPASLDRSLFRLEDMLDSRRRGRP